jgi:SHS family sialic acid transporter-like MFS transporter
MMDKGDRMHSSTDSAGSQKGKWMALLAALLGWMFDGFEMGLFPLVGTTALRELGVDQTETASWFGVIMAVFLVGAATGGVLFGWLGDRIGRVRAMALSIATYAVFTGLCGFASEAWHIAVLRFIASLGMGGEWALGVALVNEIWSDKSRAFLAGLIGAAANVGMLLVGLLSLVLVSFIKRVETLFESIGMSETTQDYLTSGEGWRLLMIAGALPAVLVFFIRMFVPESEKWEAEREKGTTSLWATRDLLGVLLGGAAAAGVIFLWSPAFLAMASPDVKEPTAVITTIRIIGTLIGLGIALVGYMFPVVRYLHRAEAAGALLAVDRKRYLGRMLLGAGLAGVSLLGTWGSVQWAPKWAIALAGELPAKGQPYFAKEYTQIALAAGAIAGTIIAALVAGRIGRRITYSLLCLASFVSLVYLYKANSTFDAMMLASVFVAGGATAAFYGWFPLYLPELFPTSIRATCQGFSFNFGRVLSAIGSLQTATVQAWFAKGIAPELVEIEAFPAAGATLAGIYIVGIFLVWLGPETKGKPLPS